MIFSQEISELRESLELKNKDLKSKTEQLERKSDVSVKFSIVFSH